MKVERRAFQYCVADRVASVGGAVVGALLFSVALVAVHRGVSSLDTLSFDQVFAYLILAASPAFFMLLAIGLYFRSTPVVLTEDGVARLTVMGTWRQIRWSEVQRVCMNQATPLANIGGPPIMQYTIEKTAGFHFPYAPGGPIFFTSQIQNHDLLVGILNDYVGRFDIPVIDERPGAGGARLQRVE